MPHKKRTDERVGLLTEEQRDKTLRYIHDRIANGAGTIRLRNSWRRKLHLELTGEKRMPDQFFYETNHGRALITPRTWKLRSWFTAYVRSR